MKKLVSLDVANSELVVSSTGFTPLHEAAYNGRTDVAEYLLTVVSNKQPLNNDGMTPAQVAADRAKWETLKMLVAEEYEKKIYYSKDNYTNLHNAVHDGDLVLVKKLV